MFYHESFQEDAAHENRHLHNQIVRVLDVEATKLGWGKDPGYKY